MRVGYRTWCSAEILVDEPPRRVRLTGSLDASVAQELEQTLSWSECCVVDCWALTAVDTKVLRASTRFSTSPERRRG